MSAATSQERYNVLKAIIASTIGSLIEWYDFFLYGTAAAMVFPKLFFPDFDPFTGQILSFGTFTIGFIARPVGGVIFGYMGDVVGRKSTLVATLLLMGISTFVIGTLPTYNDVGIAAPILLTFLRALQGIGVGGEWGGAVLLALESGHKGRRGLFASFPQAGVPLGLLSSTGVMTLCQMFLDESAFMTWGWRVPFFLSALLVVVGLLIRAAIREPELFTDLQKSARTERTPIITVIRLYWREIVLVAGSRLVENSIFYLFTVHVLSYATKIHDVERGVVLRAINIAAVISCFTMPLFGLLSDFVSRKAVYVAACLVVFALAWPCYAMMGEGEVWLTFAIIAPLALGHAALYSVQGSLIPELFGTSLRYSGSSLGYQLAGPFAGGLAPIIATWLVELFPGQSWPLATYVAVLSLISLACVLLLAETSRRRLDG